jgi:hypothetical protein
MNKFNFYKKNLLTTKKLIVITSTDNILPTSKYQIKSDIIFNKRPILHKKIQLLVLNKYKSIELLTNINLDNNPVDIVNNNPVDIVNNNPVDIINKKSVPVIKNLSNNRKFLFTSKKINNKVNCVDISTNNIPSKNSIQNKKIINIKKKNNPLEENNIYLLDDKQIENLSFKKNINKKLFFKKYNYELQNQEYLYIIKLFSHISDISYFLSRPSIDFFKNTVNF